MRDSFDRAEQCIKFVVESDQWDEEITQQRSNDNKESLTINKIMPYLQANINQLQDLNLKIRLYDNFRNDETDVSNETLEAFQLLCNHINLHDNKPTKPVSYTHLTLPTICSV